MDFVAEMKRKAKTFKKSLVLPEGYEERTVQAAAKIVAEGLVSSLTLLGKRAILKKRLHKKV